MKARALAALMILLPFAANAQQKDPSYRDPGTATIYSVVLPGGGQLYSGETTRGLMLLGGSSAAILAGSALSSPAKCDYDAAFSFSCKEANNTPLRIGMLASLGIWGYGIYDAKKSAERMNLKREHHTARIEPTFDVRGSQSVVGVKIGF